ncbi:hypothetical protein EAI_02265 [Harpegnathos saltator]|uniref:Uncharacterized protein n=1 Tax=Harpegnathos saltator TaxID=610380 RepID=E2BTE8_HARSA|nr:hypothetical protein EAI_02265 [Harpegnathos saltator]
MTMLVAVIPHSHSNRSTDKTEAKFAPTTTVSRSGLRLFLRCYGFLIYDKPAKLESAKLFLSNEDARVRDVAAVLNECSTLAGLKVSVREHLARVKNMLADPSVIGAVAPECDESTRRNQLYILDVAKQSLEYVFAFICDSDQLRRNVDESIRRNQLYILDVAKQSLEYVFAFICDSDQLRRNVNVN